MSWTNVAKPTGTTYTNVNPQGKEQYDQSDVIYDSATTYYDGVNTNQWTDVSKPSYSLTWNQLPIAWKNYNNTWGSPTWTSVNKPQ